MNVKEEKICRLCLKVAENDIEIIDESTRKIFEVLLLRVNLDKSKDPIICKSCAEVVAKCFNFKSACIDKKKHIFFSYINTNRATFESENVYKDKKDIEPVIDNFLCRFCSNHINGSNFVLLETILNDVKFVEMLQMHMPEMDLDFTDNSKICTSCRQDLDCYIKFVRNSLDIEEKILKYIQSKNISSSIQIKLSEVVYCSYNNMELDYTQIQIIKQEDTLEDVSETHSKVYDGQFIKPEEPLNIKDEEVYFNEIPPKEIPSSTKYISEQNIYKCAMCVYQTDCKYNLKTHMWIHEDITDKIMYKCLKCTYETRYKINLKRHMLIHKDITEMNVYKCTTCSFETKHKNSLTRHIILNHKDIMEVEMYKCTICPYKTKHKVNLKKHKLIHKDITEVEMYKCLMCTYETKDKSNLRKHILIHKDITEVEMHKCSMCTFETRHRNNLKSHVLIHKDITEMEMYKCSVCTHETKRKRDLERHMLIHKDMTEVETYKCSRCTHETKHKRGFKSHMLVHKDITEVEMYKCTTCCYKTKHKSAVKRHKCKTLMTRNNF